MFTKKTREIMGLVLKNLVGFKYDTLETKGCIAYRKLVRHLERSVLWIRICVLTR